MRAIPYWGRAMMAWVFAPLVFGVFFAANASAGFDNFITRDGHRLMDGAEEFRFAGIHTAELHRIEDDARGVCPEDSRDWGQYFKWPTEDEQENWIKSLVRVGQKATRIYVLSVQHSSDVACGRETHILAPAVSGGMPRLNERAMLVYDRMIALADEHGLRLILPFIDHWWWWGGQAQLAEFYGEPEYSMYDVNTQSFAAYKHIIEQVITRKNTITGRYYHEEKAILSWETGNELLGTNSDFLNETVALIESLAPSQLIMDGTYTRINDYALQNPDVDIVSNHYPSAGGVVGDLVAVDGEKAYFVGEFGLAPFDVMTDIMDAIVDTSHNGAQVAGGLVWGLRGRRHDGGFYWHRESGGIYSYHYPGFPEGDANDEQDVVNLVRDAAAKMAGLSSTPPLPVPEAPILRPITTLDNIMWLGAPVGRFNRIERAESESGPWITIGENISDGKNRFDPQVDVLFADTTAEAGSTYYYRVFASNESGESGPSNIEAFNLDSDSPPPEEENPPQQPEPVVSEPEPVVSEPEPVAEEDAASSGGGGGSIEPVMALLLLMLFVFRNKPWGVLLKA